MAYPAGFTLLTEKAPESGGFQAALSSNAVTIGDMLALAVGATTWADATASTEHWQMKGIAQETVTTAATVINLQLIWPGQVWVAELANNSDAAHNGDRMLLTDTNTVNNTGTDDASQNAVFIQSFPIGAAAEKRAVGFIVFGAGVNPDAA